MKSRRRIAFTKAGTTPNRTRLQQGFAASGMGLGVSLHGSNLGPPMSALGQKQTLRRILVMSALPPKADITERGWHVRFVPKADIGSFIEQLGGGRTSSPGGRKRTFFATR
jgi:hypothetical protein